MAMRPDVSAEFRLFVQRQRGSMSHWWNGMRRYILYRQCIGQRQKSSVAEIMCFMKSGRKIGKVKELLAQTGKQVFMVENCGMENEHVYRKIEELPEEAGYYSLIIAKEQNAGNEKSDTRVNVVTKVVEKWKLQRSKYRGKRNDSIK